jgi:hypothetical protein
MRVDRGMEKNLPQRDPIKEPKKAVENLPQRDPVKEPKKAVD